MCITICLTSLTYIMTSAILPDEDDLFSTLIDSKLKERDYQISKSQTLTGFITQIEKRFRPLTSRIEKALCPGQVFFLHVNQESVQHIL